MKIGHPYDLDQNKSIVLPPLPSFHTRSYNEPCSATWVKVNKLIKSNRPGYPGNNIDEETAIEWMKCVDQRVGMLPKSILTFLSNEELKDFYTFDLLAFYRKYDINTYHVPTIDPYGFDKEIFDKNARHKIWNIYRVCPKPLLIHCSAGIHRTGAAVHYLLTGQPKPVMPAFNDWQNYRHISKSKYFGQKDSKLPQPKYTGHKPLTQEEIDDVLGNNRL